MLSHCIKSLSQQLWLNKSLHVHLVLKNTPVCTCKHLRHRRVTWGSGHLFAPGRLPLCIPLISPANNYIKTNTVLNARVQQLTAGDFVNWISGRFKLHLGSRGENNQWACASGIKGSCSHHSSNTETALHWKHPAASFYYQGKKLLLLLLCGDRLIFFPTRACMVSLLQEIVW